MPKMQVKEGLKLLSLEQAAQQIETAGSGLQGIAEQAEEVRAAYNDAFILDPTADKDGWVRISGVRR